MYSGLKSQTARERDIAIFVGGIVGHVTENHIRDYFEQFGPIYSITLIPKKGNRTLNSGYCFISFKESNTKRSVLEEQNHFICGRRINCKSLLKGSDLKEEKTKNNQKKLCIKFLPLGTTEDQFEKFFSQYGKIHSFYLVTYKNSQKPTCNGYVVYKTENTVNRLLDMRYVKYGQDRLKVEQYFKIHTKDDQSKQRAGPQLKSIVELGSITSIRPTHAKYYNQRENNVSDFKSNFRFNILLSPTPITSSNRKRLIAKADSEEGLRTKSHKF